jgi:hypothetical protein
VEIVRDRVSEDEPLVKMAEGGWIFAHNPESGADASDAFEAKRNVGAGKA